MVLLMRVCNRVGMRQHVFDRNDYIGKSTGEVLIGVSVEKMLGV